MHPRYALLLLTALLALWLAFAACDGDEDTAAPTSRETPEADQQGEAKEPVPPAELEGVGGDPPQEGELDPCSLVTKAEVEQIIDELVADTYRHTSPTVLCEWYSDEEASFGSVAIRLETAVSQAELEDEIRLGEELGGSQAEAVPGIGDAAYSVGPLLFAYQGDTLLVIAVIAHSSPELEGAKELAPRALARLP